MELREKLRVPMRTASWLGDSGRAFVGCVFVIADKIIRLTEFVKLDK